MTHITAVREALAATITTAGLPTHPTWPGTITPPCAVIMRDTTTHGQTIGPPTDRAATHRLTIHVYVATTTQHTATSALDAALDTLTAALDADPTLGDAVDYAIPLTTSAETLTTIGAVDYLTARVSVETT